MTKYDFSLRLVVIAAIILMLIVATESSVSAQSPNQWEPDRQVPGYLDDTLTPILVADQNRTVHALASQWVGDEDKQLAIVYSQWSLVSGWTTPVDILLWPDGGAQILGAFLDQAGTLHLIFAGGDPRWRNIYYSRAPAVNAAYAPAWSKPISVGDGAASPSSAVLVGDKKDRLFIIYNGNIAGKGVYVSMSSDAGNSWSEPEPIFLTHDPEQIPFSLQATIDKASQLHVVWNVVTSLGTDVSLHYARLDVADQEWSDPILLEESIEAEGFFGPSYPSIVANGDNIVVMYNSGNPNQGGSVDFGRPIQRVLQSYDGGQTWMDPINPFPKHLGRSGQSGALVVDSNGVVNAVIIQRIESFDEGLITVIGGMWHSVMHGDSWTKPVVIPITISAHDVRAVITQGNVLLVTWRQDPGQGQSGIWYTYTILDAPELPVVPLPTVTAKPIPTLQPTKTSFIVSPTPIPEAILLSQNDAGVERDTPARPIFLALIPVVLFLGVILLLNQISRFSQS